MVYPKLLSDAEYYAFLNLLVIILFLLLRAEAHILLHLRICNTFFFFFSNPFY